MRTRTRLRMALAAALAALVFAAVPVHPQGAAAPAPPAAARPQPPINFRSDRAEYRSEENLVILEGKAMVTQGEDSITADRMEATLVPAPEGEAGGEPASAGGRKEPAGERPAEGEVGQQLKKIVATGNVTVRQIDPQTKKERYAVGERGEYDADARTMVLTGNPRLWEGKNVLTGEKIIFELDTKRFRVEGKVNLTVYPEETKGRNR